MPHEDQEALDALRLLSSGYGAQSPQLEASGAAPQESLCNDAEEGASKESGGGGKAGRGEGAKKKEGDMLAGLAATPTDHIFFAKNKGEGKDTPHATKTKKGAANVSVLQSTESGNCVMSESAGVAADMQLDTETAAAIRQWGAAMSQLWGVNSALTGGGGSTNEAAPFRMYANDGQMLGAGVGAQSPSPWDLAMANACGVGGLGGLCGLQGFNLAQLASLASMPGLLPLAASIFDNVGTGEIDGAPEAANASSSTGSSSSPSSCERDGDGNDSSAMHVESKRVGGGAGVAGPDLASAKTAGALVGCAGA
jgi:hypothetical protein